MAESGVIPVAVVLALAACAGDRVVSGPSVERLEPPLLRFDVVDIPAPGSAADVDGAVEVLVPSNGWVAVKVGTPLGDESKIRIGAGAALTVQFSATERIEFRPAPAERWVVLEESSADPHGT
jgi:hypothetical protein